MNRDHLPPTPDDALLQRYREANELDTARPGAALRENVLAHARAVAASRLETPPPNARPAANDSAWTWRALGSLAVIGLVGLLVLQFDRGTPHAHGSMLLVSSLLCWGAHRGRCGDSIGLLLHLAEVGEERGGQHEQGSRYEQPHRGGLHALAHAVDAAFGLACANHDPAGLFELQST